MKDIQGCSWKRNKGETMREKQNQTYKKSFLRLQRRARKLLTREKGYFGPGLLRFEGKEIA